MILQKCYLPTYYKNVICLRKYTFYQGKLNVHQLIWHFRIKTHYFLIIYSTYAVANRLVCEFVLARVLTLGNCMVTQQGRNNLILPPIIEDVMETALIYIPHSIVGIY